MAEPTAFFERRKEQRQSEAGGLRQSLRWRNGLAPLLAVAGLVMVLFIMPPDIADALFRGVSKVPGGAAAARLFAKASGRLGSGAGGGGQPAFSGLLAAMKAAKDSRGSGWGAFFRGGAIGSGSGDSLSMVRGTPAGAALGPANLGEKIKGGDSVAGILTPKEARESGAAVALAPGDISGARAAVARSTGGLEGATAYARPGLFEDGDGRAVNPDLLGATLGSAAVPKAAGQARGAAANVKPGSFAVGGAGGSARQYQRKGGVVLGQLVMARNAALISSKPMCQASNGCSSEFAAIASGANYDGAKLGGGRATGASGGGSGVASGLNGSGSAPAMLSAPVPVDGASVPAVPDTGSALPGSAAPGAALRTGPMDPRRCRQALDECRQEHELYRGDFDQQTAKLKRLTDQLPKACSDPCRCGPCNQVQSKIAALCQGPLADDLNRLSNPCAPPPGCGRFNLEPAGAAKAPAAPAACEPGAGPTCGCTGVMCDASCLLGL